MTDPLELGWSRTWLPLVGALAGLGCSADPCASQGFDPPPQPEPGPASPPEVLAGAWIGAGVLELQFSGPLGSFGSLDPSRFALVTWDALASGGYGSGADTCYLSTRYRQLGVGYYLYGQTAIAELWIAPEDPTLLRLRMAQAGAQCPSASNSVADGLLLAYTSVPGAGPELRDVDGELVPDLGPAWAITELDACIVSSDGCYVYNFARGHLPALTSLAPIPCP